MDDEMVVRKLWLPARVEYTPEELEVVEENIAKLTAEWFDLRERQWWAMMTHTWPGMAPPGTEIAWRSDTAFYDRFGYKAAVLVDVPFVATIS